MGQVLSLPKGRRLCLDWRVSYLTCSSRWLLSPERRWELGLSKCLAPHSEAEGICFPCQKGLWPCGLCLFPRSGWWSPCARTGASMQMGSLQHSCFAFQPLSGPAHLGHWGGLSRPPCHCSQQHWWSPLERGREWFGLAVYLSPQEPAVSLWPTMDLWNLVKICLVSPAHFYSSCSPLCSNKGAAVFVSSVTFTSPACVPASAHQGVSWPEV